MNSEPQETPSRMAITSDDQWLVQCLTLAAFSAMAYSQLIGENVFLALM